MNRREFVKLGLCSSFLAGMAFYGKNYISENKNNDNINLNDDHLDYLEVSAVDHCNFHCKYCYHFSTIATKHFYDIKKYTQDLERIADITSGNISNYKIIGGEPLLHPQINEIMSLSRKYFQGASMFLATNGILLNYMGENFWQTLSDNNIYLIISFYSNKINWQTIFDNIKRYNIETNMTQEILENIDDHLTKIFENLNMDFSGSQTDMTRCSNCYNNCTILQNSKIYKCPLASNIHYLNKKYNLDLKLSKEDYLDIYKIKSLKELLSLRENSVPFCKYCREPINQKWEISTKHTSDEWGS